MSELPTPTFSTFTPWPSRSDAEPDYDVKTDAAHDSQETFHEELTGSIPWFEQTRDRAETAAEAAEASAFSATAVANYRGEYHAGTLYEIGESVSKSGSTSLFVKKTTAPEGTSPVAGIDWLEIERPVTPTYTGDVDITGNFFATTVDDTRVELSGATTYDIDLDAGGEFHVSMTATTTLTVSNPPANNRSTSKTIIVTTDGDYDLNWWSGILTLGGEAPTPPDSGQTKRFTLGVATDSGGTTTYTLGSFGVVA